LLIALRSGEQALRSVLILLMLAFCMIFAIHVNRLYEVLSGTFSWVERVSVAWAPAIMLIVGAAQTIKNILQRDEDMGRAVAPPERPADAFFSTGRWKSLLSLITVLAVSSLIVLLWLAGIKKIFHGQIALICVGGFIVLMLVVLRQLLAVYEISVLQRKLQRRNRALALLNDLLGEQATTDSLTGLPNHRELMVRLDEALALAQATTATCAVIFMDLDHFKDINDHYGHLIGDAVLCEVSELVLSAIRVDDCLGRWGGEEFVAILPGMGPIEAFQMAERIRMLVEQHAFVDEQEVPLTCSLGTATYPYVATRREDLLARADSAMYTAKRLGRNQTRMALEPLVLAVGMLGEAAETAEEAKMLAVVESFIAALEARDYPTGQHSRRVAVLSLRLALALGLTWSDACIVGMGGLLHDLGKVAMPDAILFKHGKLSAAEIEYMARHPLIGEEILAPLPSLRAVAALVRAHHEWINGSGYPDGLRGDGIPLGARIVAVSDAYDAIISHRIYRQARAPAEATKELHEAAGKQFDPRVVEALDRLLVATPQASLIGTP
jgi:diguanylate cyclase (GGDEF)-like protein